MVCSARRMRRRAAAAARQAPSAAACRRAAARASARRSSAPCTRRAAASAAHPASMPAACARVAVAARRAASAARSLAFGRCMLGFGSLAGTVQSRMQPTRCAASAAAHQACQGPTHSMTLFVGPGAHDQQWRASPASRLVATAQIARQHISDRRTLSLTAQGGATAAHLLASDRARQAANAAARRRDAVCSTAARRRPCPPTRALILAISWHARRAMVPVVWYAWHSCSDAHADGVSCCQACELHCRMVLQCTAWGHGAAGACRSRRRAAAAAQPRSAVRQRRASQRVSCRTTAVASRRCAAAARLAAARSFCQSQATGVSSAKQGCCYMQASLMAVAECKAAWCYNPHGHANEVEAV